MPLRGVSPATSVGHAMWIPACPSAAIAGPSSGHASIFQPSSLTRMGSPKGRRCPLSVRRRYHGGCPDRCGARPRRPFRRRRRRPSCSRNRHWPESSARPDGCRPSMMRGRCPDEGLPACASAWTRPCRDRVSSARRYARRATPPVRRRRAPSVAACQPRAPVNDAPATVTAGENVRPPSSSPRSESRFGPRASPARRHARHCGSQPSLGRPVLQTRGRHPRCR